MTPVYDLQNPPRPSDFKPVDQHNDDQFLQLFLSSTAAASSSSSVSFPTNFFDTSQDNYQRMIKVDQDQFHHVPHDHDHQQKHVHGGPNYDAIQEFSSSSSLLENPATGRSSDLKLYLSKREVGEGSRSEQGSPSPSSGKWVSSKVKPSCIAGDDQSAKINEINSRSSSSSSSSSTNNNVRFCSDCSTTTTPLWRSGPRGPKSLCNACGIRQRKARKAMEAAAAAAATATAGSPSIKIKVVNNKEKKSRSNQRKLCFKDFALSLSKNSALKQVLPQDVEEAAILLMELSCGFIQS